MAFLYPWNTNLGNSKYFGVNSVDTSEANLGNLVTKDLNIVDSLVEKLTVADIDHAWGIGTVTFNLYTPIEFETSTANPATFPLYKQPGKSITNTEDRATFVVNPLHPDKSIVISATMIGPDIATPAPGSTYTLQTVDGANLHNIINAAVSGDVKAGRAVMIPSDTGSAVGEAGVTSGDGVGLNWVPSLLVGNTSGTAAGAGIIATVTVALIPSS